jgi:hypothetical protein
MPKGGGIVRDVLAGKEIVVFWQPATRTAVAYALKLDDPQTSRVDRLAFDLADPAAPFFDGETKSRFDIAGRAVSGPLKGKTLTWIDSVQCRWFAWAAEYPRTDITQQAKVPQKVQGGEAVSQRPATREMVLVDCNDVTSAALARWRKERFSAVVVPLDENHSAKAYVAAAAAINAAGLDLYYWIEIARNKPLADAHPRWMASLGMHDDWLARFPKATKPSKTEVAKAYPWVPIGYGEAFQAHLRRVERLLNLAPGDYRGLLLNDVQGGPAACGCGNLRCRWAIDYGVAGTATQESVDDAAARFVVEVAKLAPQKQLVPVWMTECERHDLPADRAPNGRTTGLCGSVPCANGTCPRAFAKQLGALLAVHQGPLGLLAIDDAGREAGFNDGPGGRIAASVAYLDGTEFPSQSRPPARERLWLIVQGEAENSAAERSARRAALQLRPAAVIVSRITVEQSYEPRTVAVDPSAS